MYTLFVVFVVLTTTILFNILIALMTATYNVYNDEAATYALLQYANTILTYERATAYYGLGKRLRSGTPGHSCGMLADIYYKGVLVKKRSAADVDGDGVIDANVADAFVDLQHLYANKKRVPG